MDITHSSHRIERRTERKVLSTKCLGFVGNSPYHVRCPRRHFAVVSVKVIFFTRIRWWHVTYNLARIDIQLATKSRRRVRRIRSTNRDDSHVRRQHCASRINPSANLFCNSAVVGQFKGQIKLWSLGADRGNPMKALRCRVYYLIVFESINNRDSCTIRCWNDITSSLTTAFPPFEPILSVDRSCRY